MPRIEIPSYTTENGGVGGRAVRNFEVRSMIRRPQRKIEVGVGGSSSGKGCFRVVVMLVID